MKKLFHISKDRLPATVCHDIIKRALQVPPMDAQIGDGKLHREIRSSELRWLPPADPAFRDIADFVHKCFMQANQQSFNVDVGWHFPMQFTTYKAADEGHYDWHQDTHWPSKMAFDRKLTFIMQLSDPTDYAGGDLELQHVREYEPSMFRERGAVLVFPSVMYHRVTPVLGGTRHSLVAWLDGPCWK